MDFNWNQFKIKRDDENETLIQFKANISMLVFLSFIPSIFFIWLAITMSSFPGTPLPAKVAGYVLFGIFLAVDILVILALLYKKTMIIDKIQKRISIVENLSFITRAELDFLPFDAVADIKIETMKTRVRSKLGYIYVDTHELSLHAGGEKVLKLSGGLNKKKLVELKGMIERNIGRTF
ncbi:MAG: hypothetical protein ACFFCS_19730 [Candidatus Hodarchaeota archaeon]